MTSNNTNPNTGANRTDQNAQATAATEPINVNRTADTHQYQNLYNSQTPGVNPQQGPAQPFGATQQPYGTDGNASWGTQSQQTWNQSGTTAPHGFGQGSALKSFSGKTIAIIAGISLGCGLIGGLGGGLAYGAISGGHSQGVSQQMQMPSGNGQGGKFQGMPGNGQSGQNGMPGQSNGSDSGSADSSSSFDSAEGTGSIQS
ncbi:hypothetical protein BW12_04290 [Bifidobacterium sp. UTCIF-3]|uniref:hypothetical protein n=1 Tax=unclassified Bifidobacterium TaxID=2608897 RepID=UPI0011274883|nr:MULTISPECIES: hypothetical protein [unclassified Bifidobacterium]TPF77461.1 hypothetical protein BW09_09670 [Bifidobacterium sp. UTCIF-1]TPF82464.1 hypothetical protein BW12_04290 [Bifidobacterium sp. UTCIF-3]TPF93111.1 hypothetical protein BW14_06475 [Bifidobacterium sp. UTBIF-68]